MSFIPPRLVKQAVELYKDECARAGWEPTPDQIVYRSILAIGENEDEVRAQQQVRANRTRPRAEYNTAPRGFGPLSWIEAEGGSVDATVNGTAAQDESASAGPGFGLGSQQFAGTPDMLVEQINAFHDMTGVGVLDFGFTGSPDAVARRLRLFGTEVLSQVREAGAKTRSLTETPASV
jgi:alkanesulfonate monooxygenase SsuD/methylene tetrahydromethanopterin reductase-like flavin-dependent oxidoreductase (luciferase family)